MIPFQIIDAIGVELKCEHVNCEYSAKRSELENHEESCKYRPEEFEEEEENDEDSEDEEEGMEDDDEAVEDEEEVRFPFCSSQIFKVCVSRV